MCACVSEDSFYKVQSFITHNAGNLFSMKEEGRESLMLKRKSVFSPQYEQKEHLLVMSDFSQDKKYFSAWAFMLNLFM